MYVFALHMALQLSKLASTAKLLDVHRIFNRYQIKINFFYFLQFQKWAHGYSPRQKAI